MVTYLTGSLCKFVCVNSLCDFLKNMSGSKITHWLFCVLEVWTFLNSNKFHYYFKVEILEFVHPYWGTFCENGPLVHAIGKLHKALGPIPAGPGTGAYTVNKMDFRHSHEISHHSIDLRSFHFVSGRWTHWSP